MSYKAFVYDSWVGGQAVDKKTGLANSFADSQALDFRKSPSQLSVLPRTRRADGGAVTDLVQNEVMTDTGRTYSIGSNGNIYTCSSTGVWSLFGNTGQTGTFGITYRKDQDAIYITGTTQVSSIVTVATTPTLYGGYYNTSQSTYDNTINAGFNVNSNQSGSNTTTAITTSYTEALATQLRYWQTDIQPVSRLGVYIATKGTGNWTLVVHDGQANQLATVTVANASLNSAAWNYFDITPLQINVGPNNAQTYHFHLTSTIADGTVSSSTTNDLSNCDMQLWADRLVATTNGLHPIETFQQFTCIGNGRYLSVWENLGEVQPSNSAWQRQKLTFPPGYEVCGLTVFNEYLVIATERVTTGTNTPQSGIIFYWDGLSDSYNYFTPIPEGSPQAITVFENSLHYVASGDRYIITSVAATPEKYRKLPFAEGIYTVDNSQTYVYPYTMDIRNGILLSAWPSVTTNQSVPFGVYSWGRVDHTQNRSFGYSYLLSTGSKYLNNTNHLTIGMVRNFGNVLHISWRDTDNGGYGVDVVDAASTPAAYANCEQLIYDGKFVTKDKTASYVEARWLTIQSGVQIRLKYAINRGDWQYSPYYSNGALYSPDGAVGYARFDVGTDTIPERFNEFQAGIEIVCDDTVTTAPVIVGEAVIFDDLNAETLQ